MSNFSELLHKSKDKSLEQVKEAPINPFAVLKKSVAASKIPSDATTDVGEVSSGSPPAEEKTSPTTTLPKTAPDDTMLGVSGANFSEANAAKEFTSPDQPEKYSKELVTEFRSSLDILVNSIENKELVSDALKKIMIDLLKYPFLGDIMHPENCQLMVRGLRSSYGVTLAKKQTRRTKKETTSADVEEVMDLIGDLDIEI